MSDVQEIATVLNAMRDAGVILDYALFGAVAQMRYTEPVATFDADVLVAVPSPEGLDVLRPLYDSRRGFSMQLELQELFAAQAAWQRERAKLSWPEKVRMAETMRESAKLLGRLSFSSSDAVRRAQDPMRRRTDAQS